MDTISKARRSHNMARILAKNTTPELIVRRLLHKHGYRFRLHRSDLPGKPDMVFPSRKSVIFVHGCFWHQHSAAKCLDGHMPKSNSQYWVKKLQANIERDRQHCSALHKMGWSVAVVWECETRRPEKLLRKLEFFLAST